MFFIVWKKARCPGRLDGLPALKADLQVEGNILDVQEVGLLETEEVGRPGKEEVVRLGTEEPRALLGGSVLGGPLPWGENDLPGVLEETEAFQEVAPEVEAEIGGWSWDLAARGFDDLLPNHLYVDQACMRPSIVSYPIWNVSYTYLMYV